MIFMKNDYEHIGACILILNIKNNQILLGKRKNAYREGDYGLPGGRTEFNESLIDNVKRELVEEAGITTTNISYIGVVKELQQKNYNFIHFGFLIKNFNGKIKNCEPNKCEGWKWFDINHLPKTILPGHKAIIEMYLNPDNANFRDLI